MKKVMEMMGLEASDEQIKAMMGEVDEGAAEPEMDFDQFLTLMAIYVGSRDDEREAELKEAFNAIDLDGGGTIDTEELGQAFKQYGEKTTDEEIAKIIAQIDVDGDGELDFDEFKTLMMTAVPKDAPDEARILRRKARTTVRALIMQARMSTAFQAFDERYNFLRFSDASTIAASEDQPIVKIYAQTSISDALEAMKKNAVLFAPVYGDEELSVDPIGFVDMMEIVHLMLGAMKLAFKLPATDSISIQMRLERITESASQFSNTPVSSVVERSWKPIRPGYSIFDLGGVLAKGVHRVPYCSMEGELLYIITQSSYLASFNQDPKIRLAGAPHCQSPAALM
jgi:calmodulin